MNEIKGTTEERKKIIDFILNNSSDISRDELNDMSWALLKFNYAKALFN